MAHLADYSSLSIFGKRFELQIEFDDTPIELEIVDDPDSEIDKTQPPEDEPGSDDSEKPDET